MHRHFISSPETKEHSVIFNRHCIRLSLVMSAAWTALLGTAFADEQTKNTDASVYSRKSIDIGTVVSDLDRSVKWYKEVLDMKELTPFQVPGDFAGQIGLSRQLPFEVRVLVLGDGEEATKLKLMQFKTAPGARVDQSYLHSTYGFRYLTLFVTDMDASIERAAKQQAKPIGKGVVPLPEGFPEGIFIAVLRDPDGNFIELVGPKGKKE